MTTITRIGIFIFGYFLRHKVLTAQLISLLLVFAPCMMNASEGKDITENKESRSTLLSETPKVSRKQITEVLIHMKKCAEESTDPEKMFFCSCESDIMLSKLPAPRELATHCRQVAQQNIEITKLPEKQQKKGLLHTGAKDIRVTSLTFFTFAVPCIIEALKTNDQRKMDNCICTTHELASQLVFKQLSDSTELMDEVTKIVKDLNSTKKCEH